LAKNENETRSSSSNTYNEVFSLVVYNSANIQCKIQKRIMLSYRLIQYPTAQCSQVYTVDCISEMTDVGRRFTCSQHNCLKTSINWPTIVALVYLHATCHAFINVTAHKCIYWNSGNSNGGSSFVYKAAGNQQTC